MRQVPRALAYAVPCIPRTAYDEMSVLSRQKPHKYNPAPAPLSVSIIY